MTKADIARAQALATLLYASHGDIDDADDANGSQNSERSLSQFNNLPAHEVQSRQPVLHQSMPGDHLITVGGGLSRPRGLPRSTGRPRNGPALACPARSRIDVSVRGADLIVQGPRERHGTPSTSRAALPQRSSASWPATVARWRSCSVFCRHSGSAARPPCTISHRTAPWGASRHCEELADVGFAVVPQRSSVISKIATRPRGGDWGQLPEAARPRAEARSRE
jgi:hypothetical protein